jgi:ABC-type transport system involved in multi-copper enzyme maturation permease subunit
MRVSWLVATYTFRELARRKVFVVVPIVTAAFLGLYIVGSVYAFRVTAPSTGFTGFSIDPRIVTGSTLLGLAMFGTFFLGVILAVFLTFSTVRGDSETGLLQPLVVRPVGRMSLLAGRFMGTVVVTVAYVVILYGACVIATGVIGGWWPERPLAAGLYLATGTVVVAALSILGSIFLSTIPNGIAVLGVFGAGLLAGLLGQIGDALSSHALVSMAKVTSWVLPFEALYQASLHALTVGTSGLTGFVVRLGPLGAAEDPGRWLGPWAFLYLAAVALASIALFARRDL